jgi:crotonobetainyl-CoA:carnitine CoA-transferase CaiB-like acyl-CoA transferase
MFRMLGTPGRIRWPGHKLGQDNAAVFAEIGVGAEQLADLHAKGVV